MANPERRPYNRFKLREAFGVLRMVGEDPQNHRIVKVTNVSLGGATLIGWSDLKVGETVSLAVNLPMLDMACHGEVVWVHCSEGHGPTANRSWSAGLHFRDLTPAERVQIKQLFADPVLGITAWARGAAVARARQVRTTALPVPVLV